MKEAVTLSPSELSPILSSASTGILAKNYDENNIPIFYDTKTKEELKISTKSLETCIKNVQSLCVSYSSTFAAAHMRNITYEKKLENLKKTINHVYKNIENKVIPKLNINGSSEINASKKESKNEGNYILNLNGEIVVSFGETNRLRRRNLLRHSNLFELMELPSIMDSCIREMLYDEVLGIAGFANVLTRRHLILSKSSSINIIEVKKKIKSKLGNQVNSSKGNIIIRKIVREIQQRENDLRRHLLNRLKVNISTTKCLEVVTALRKLNDVELERTSIMSSSSNASNKSSSFTTKTDIERVHNVMEWKLMVEFLDSRGFWLETGGSNLSILEYGISSIILGDSRSMELSSSSKTPTVLSEELSDIIDIYRTRCLEIASQFQVLFLLPSNITESNINILQSSSSPVPFSNLTDNSIHLLSSWTTRCIELFITRQLSSHNLSLINDAAMLRDALDSTLFFSTSMGRIGADFSFLLPQIFLPRLTEIITSHWIHGFNCFQDMLRRCRERNDCSPLYNNSDFSGPHMVSSSTLKSNYNTPTPPRQLINIPPIASLVNSYLEGLNELRRCLIPMVFHILRKRHKEFCRSVINSLIHNNDVLSSGMKNSDVNGMKSNNSYMVGEEIVISLSEAAKYLQEGWINFAKPYLDEAMEVAFCLSNFESSGGDNGFHINTRKD